MVLKSLWLSGLGIAFPVEVTQTIFPRRHLPHEGLIPIVNLECFAVLDRGIERSEEVDEFVGENRGDRAFKGMFFPGSELAQGTAEFAGHMFGMLAVKEVIELLHRLIP
jgi:hypothetical protein